MSAGRIIGIATLFSLICIIILSAYGYFAYAPVPILVGTFFVGFVTKEVKGGAIIGIITAISVLIVLGIIFSVLFFLAIIVGVLAFLIWPLFSAVTTIMELVEIIFITLAYSIIFSPVMGSIGGFVGRLFFSIDEQQASLTRIPTTQAPPTRAPPTKAPTKSQFPPGFENLSHIKPPNTISCPSCGTLNYPNSNFCKNCGTRLQ
ncbi:MAG: zinc ribbon domain-containing protein [Candidatus Heimdallarchaeota archaeon]